MISSNQQINETGLIKAVSGIQRKSYRATVLFIAWLAYSMGALGWFILDAPASVSCTKHIN